MNIALAIKVSFWLILLGVAALLTPNPAWPEWVARILISLGVAILVTSFIAPRLRNRKKD